MVTISQPARKKTANRTGKSYICFVISPYLNPVILGFLRILKHSCPGKISTNNRQSLSELIVPQNIREKG
jgi:hypothetical protein